MRGAMEEVAVDINLSSTCFSQQTLQSLIQSSKSQEGRLELASCNLIPLLLNFIQQQQEQDHLLLSLKLIRNLCGGETCNQGSFIDNNGPAALVSLFSPSVSTSDDVIQLVLQAFANAASAGERHQSTIWGSLFPENFKWVLGNSSDLKILDPLCMVMYKCVCDSRERLDLLYQGKGLLIMADLLRKVEELGQHENIKKPWDSLNLLLERVCSEEFSFSQLFQGLGLVSDSAISNDITCQGNYKLEQAILLRIVLDIFDQQREGFAISENFASCIFSIFKSATDVVLTGSKSTSKLPTGVPSIDILGYSLNILRQICSRDASFTTQSGLSSSTVLQKEEHSHVMNLLLKSNFVQVMVSLLRDLEPPAIIKKAREQSMSQAPDSKVRANSGDGPETSESLEDRGACSCAQEAVTIVNSPKLCAYRGFRRDLVAVLGNCLYQRKDVQDDVRHLGGVLVLLEQCVVDDENPYLREWGIWAVRNLLDCNPENQREVSELRLQGTVDTPEISGLGLKVQVETTTGRARLVNMT